MAPVPVWCLELDEQHDLGRRWPGWMFMREWIYTVIINKKRRRNSDSISTHTERTQVKRDFFFLSLYVQRLNGSSSSSHASNKLLPTHISSPDRARAELL
jgi:hypothetical protein